MRRRNSHAIGRTRTKLAQLLEAALAETDAVKSHMFAFTVAPGDLHAAQGSNRTSASSDCYRWEGAAYTPTRLPVFFYSYETMTRCVRKGIVLVEDHDNRGRVTPGHFDVYAKE